MDKLGWCLRKGKGIRLVSPSVNLPKSYVKKAEDSLISMRLNHREGINDWAASAAYYARYHALYALLMKCGIKSEIHECTIAAAKGLFRDVIPDALIRDIETAKDQRIDMQYYTDRVVDAGRLSRNIETAGDFVMHLKEIIGRITEEDVKNAREKLRKLA
jgi:uncharacterized protein (UPF0332 family)